MLSSISTTSTAAFCTHCVSLVLLCCVVEPDDEAVSSLADHFRTVIAKIADDSWRHYRVRWLSSEKKQLFAVGSEHLSKSMVVDRNPKFFFLQYHQLGERLQSIRDKVVSSFRNYNFQEATPVLQRLFPADLVGKPGSGIDGLFPPRRSGRPKKRKQPDEDLEYVPLAVLKRSMRRRTAKRQNKDADPLIDASSGEDVKFHPIAFIHLQAQDATSGKVYVFVEWEGWPLTASSWILLSSLAPATANAWRIEREMLFPLISDENFPSYRYMQNEVCHFSFHRVV